MERNGISVCMIVKDEEKALRRCLQSVMPIADELIIVDTGSTDSTIDLAREYTSLVYQHPWEDDFSKARNIALSYCTQEWVFQIDADEELGPAAVNLVRESVLDDEITAVWVSIVSVMAGGGEGQAYFPRLYRRKNTHYENRVHNVVICPGKHIFRDIKIWHYGYNLPPEELQKKYEYREKLIQMEIEEDPGNAMHWANLTRMIRCRSDWERLAQVVEKFYTLAIQKRIQLNDHAAQIVMIDHINALIALQAYEEAARLCANLVKYYPGNPDGYYQLGSLCLHLGDFQKCIEHTDKYMQLNKAMRQDIQATTMIWDSWGNKTLAEGWNNCGVAYAMLSKKAQAVTCFQEAIKLSNDSKYQTNMIALTAGISQQKPAYTPVNLTL